MRATNKTKDKEALRKYQEKLQYIIDNTEINPFEDVNDKEKRIARAKKDYAFFMQYYLPHYATTKTPDFHVNFANKVKKNPKYKGWAKWGRALAKSVECDVGLPLWLWIGDDIDFMVLIGQNYDKACILLDDLKLEFEGNQRLINDFGPQHKPGKWESGFFQTKNGFIAKALGRGQDPRGLRVGNRRPDYMVFDDLEDEDTVNNPKRQRRIANWILRSVIPSMDVGNRRAVIAQNHFADQMIFSLITDENKNWDVDRVDAYDSATFEPRWPDKYHRWFFRDIELEIGSLAARAEYNNEPHVEGKVFLDEYIQYSPIPKLKDFEAIVGIWDVAYAGTKGSDFNAVRVWGLYKGKKYLIDCLVKQCKIPVALNWIAEFQKTLPIGVSVQFRFESQFWNETVYENINDCELQHGFTLNLVKMDSDKRKKYDRMVEMVVDYQNGKVYYNEALKAHNDTKVGLAQLKGLEPGYTSKDDAPDADKYAFDYLDKFKPTSKPGDYRFSQRTNQRF